MAVTVVAQTKVKTPKMKSVKAAPSHPTYLKMIHEAIASIKDRKGASRQAIKAFIAEKYMLDDNTGSFTRNLNNTLKKGVTDGTLKQPYGNQGRFGLGEAAAKKTRATKAKSSHSGSLDKKKKTKSADSASSIPKAKSAPKTKTTGTTKKTAVMKSAKSTETTKKTSAKAKTSTKTAKENKGKTVNDTQPSKKATTKAQPKASTVSKKASSMKKPSTKTNA